MPIYEYHCQDCKSEFELLIRSTEQPDCPDCGNKQIEKKISLVASPVSESSSLPICPTTQSGCGLPQCGGGGCHFD